jgi:hypothetical protein
MPSLPDAPLGPFDWLLPAQAVAKPITTKPPHILAMLTRMYPVVMKDAQRVVRRSPAICSLERESINALQQYGRKQAARHTVLETVSHLFRDLVLGFVAERRLNLGKARLEGSSVAQ